MANDKVTIAISAKDNYSVVMEKLSQATKGTATDISSFQKRLDVLNRTKLRLQVDVEEAKKKLREAKKVYEDSQKAMESATDAMGKSADEANDALNSIGVTQAKNRFEELQEEYNNLASSLSAVSSQAKETERSMRSLKGTGKVVSSEAATLGDLVKTAASSQLATQLFGSLGDAATAYISSAYGENAGIYTSSVGSGLFSGASAGAMLGSVLPGIGTAVGTAIGAVVGGISGLLSAETQIFENKDDFFKDLVKTNYDEVTEKFEDKLSSGKTVAGQRETDMLAFERLLGGRDQAQGYLDKLVDKAAITPFGYDDLTAMSKTLATFGYNQDEMLDMINKVGDTGAALGMDASGMTAVATYLGRMKSSGKTTLEYLNPLIERGIPVMDYLSESLSKSKTEIYDMVSKGLIPGEEAAKVIADYMGHDFAGSMENMSHTYDGMLSTIEDYETQLQNAMGEAYNKERKDGVGGLSDQIDWYEKNSKEMEEMYQKLGTWKAEQDNAADKILFDTYQELLDSDWENINEGDLYAKLLSAETEAAAKYTDTTQFEAMNNAQSALVDKLGTALAPKYKKMGYDMAQWFTKGYEAYLEYEESTPKVGIGTSLPSIGSITGTKKTTKQAAFGLSYVPYNDYPVRLHEGERVLTASQNREYMSGGHGGVVVNVSNMTVRSESDIDSIAEELYRRIRLANANYSGVG